MGVLVPKFDQAVKFIDATLPGSHGKAREWGTKD
jgi:hypothetical protein